MKQVPYWVPALSPRYLTLNLFGFVFTFRVSAMRRKFRLYDPLIDGTHYVGIAYTTKDDDAYTTYAEAA